MQKTNDNSGSFSQTMVEIFGLHFFFHKWLIILQENMDKSKEFQTFFSQTFIRKISIDSNLRKF